jgi:hypothetical protein
MNRNITIGVVAVTLAMSGCAGTGVTAVSSGTASATPSSPSAAYTSPAEPTEEIEDPTLSFGETATYDDGLALNVSAPKAYKPSEYAAGSEGYSEFVSFTITLVNKTGKPFDPAMAMQSVMSGDAEASSIFDGDTIGGSPSTKVLNGRTVKWTVAYGVKNPADLTMEIAPSFEHSDTIYTNNAG